MLSALLVMRWVSPDRLGFWNSIILFQSYSIFAQLGVFTGLSRELPYLLGKKENELAHQYAQIAQFVAHFLMYASILIGFVVLLFLATKGFDNIRMASALVLIISISLNFYQNYLIVTFRSNQAFKNLSIVYLIQFPLLVISLLFVYLWGYNGFLLRHLLISISLTFLCYLYRPLNIKSVYIRRKFFDLIKIGFPFFSFAYIQTLTSSFTRIALLSFSNVLMVGLFSPALAVISAMMMIPTTIAQYLAPRMSFAYGETDSKRKIWNYVRKSSFLIITILLPLVLIGYFILPDFIRLIFPEYIAGTFAARMVLISGLFNALTISNNSLLSIRAMKPFMFLTLFKFVSYFILIFSFAFFSTNILNDVALGYFLAEVLFGITSILTCYFVLNRNEK